MISRAYPCTVVLIVMNVISYWALPAGTEYNLAFRVDAVISKAEVWRCISFQFVHLGIGHLLGNMIGVWIFGAIVERRLGPHRWRVGGLVFDKQIAAECGFGGGTFLILNSKPSAF